MIDKSSLVKVNLFDEEIILDKTIYVSLDNSIDLFEMFPDVAKDMCFAGSFKELCEMIKQRRNVIITPITKCITVQIMELGYEIIVQSKNKYVKFSELLNGKEIRQTQNWEKMLLSGCFNLDIPDWR